jgi:hypothetical protein
MGMHLIGVLYWATANFFLDTVPFNFNNAVPPFPHSCQHGPAHHFSFDESASSGTLCNDIIRIRVRCSSSVPKQKSFGLEAKKGELLLVCIVAKQQKFDAKKQKCKMHKTI